MSISCPNCKTDLPDHGELEYRFCPRCGAGITARGRENIDDFLTIPPDLNHTTAQRREKEPEAEGDEKPPAVLPDQTLEPAIAEEIKPRPAIVPPPGPPPASFYRADLPHPASKPEVIQDGPVDAPRKPFKLFIIIVGAITILIGAILYILLG